LKISRHL